MPLGENGQGLSGGQKQLVALARLTLKDPKVVLLDEPTSDLDQGSEMMVLNALANWTKNRTMSVVTHRPQVLRIVERVIVVENGKIVLDGPRDAVLAKLRENEQAKKQQNSTASTKQAEPVATQSQGSENNEQPRKN
ncbi:ATP-binding cassette domain-containing protein [Actinobacillus equuli subsp. haemolyticus]|nr:ATP-binding cassette domain-containing protein [Actinobacillus equuli subsp. haemolyticus]